MIGLINNLYILKILALPPQNINNEGKPVQSNNADATNESKNNTKPDYFQFILALVIVVPFVIYIGLFQLSNMTQQAKDVLSMMGAFVGTIVGFYFGQKPVQNLTKQVQQESSEKTKFRSGLADSSSKVDDTLEENKKLKQDITNLSNQIMTMREKYVSDIMKFLEINGKENKLGGSK